MKSLTKWPTFRFYNTQLARSMVVIVLSLLISNRSSFAQESVRAGELVVSLKGESSSTHVLSGEKLKTSGFITSVRSLSSNRFLALKLSTLPPGISSFGQESKYNPSWYQEACAQVKKSAQVSSCSANFVYHISKTPNDPEYNKLYGLNHISAPSAWDKTTGTHAIIVAVVDSGIDYRHPDLAANMWVNPREIAENGIDDDGNGFIDDVYGANFIADQLSGDPFDDNGHGTHCAGTIGAVGNNNVGVVGVNWDVSLMALKFISADGTGDSAAAISAIQYATSKGAKVINASWGGPGFSAPLRDAIKDAGNKGVLFVAAAGNGLQSGGSNVDIGINNDVHPQRTYPSSFPLDSIIAVAATDANDNLTSFSNFGPTSVDVAAPGDNIESTYPGNAYALLSGTSMAAPHVAGVAALILAHTSISVPALKKAILSSVDQKSALSGKIVSAGVVNASAAITASDIPQATVTPTPTPDPNTSPSPTPTPRGGGGGSGADDPNRAIFSVHAGTVDSSGIFQRTEKITSLPGSVELGMRNYDDTGAVILKLLVKGTRCQLASSTVDPDLTTILSISAVKLYKGKAKLEVYNGDGIFSDSTVVTFSPSSLTRAAKNGKVTGRAICRAIAKTVK